MEIAASFSLVKGVISEQRVRLTCPLAALTKDTIESHSGFVSGVINTLLLCTIR